MARPMTKSDLDHATLMLKSALKKTMDRAFWQITVGMILIAALALLVEKNL